jgi:hypothetical protein
VLNDAFLNILFGFVWRLEIGFALSRTGVCVLKNHGSTCLEVVFVIIIEVKIHWTW